MSNKKDETKKEKKDVDNKPKKKAGRPKKTEKPEPKVEEVKTEEPKVEEVKTEEPKVEKAEEKSAVMNQELFDELIKKYEKYQIVQNGVAIANYSPYLQIRSYETHFLLFDKRFAYEGITIIEK